MGAARGSDYSGYEIGPLQALKQSADKFMFSTPQRLKSVIGCSINIEHCAATVAAFRQWVGCKLAGEDRTNDVG